MNLSLEERFFKYTVKQKFGCWLWIGSMTRGNYGIIRPTRSRKMLRVHRVSWIIHKGPIPAGLCVLHKCDNPPCVNPDHLFLGTLKDNTQDMLRKNRTVRYLRKGERSGKLTWAKVRKIRAILTSNRQTQKEIAEEFGVSEETICSISRGKTWKQELLP